MRITIKQLKKIIREQIELLERVETTGDYGTPNFSAISKTGDYGTPNFSDDPLADLKRGCKYVGVQICIKSINEKEVTFVRSLHDSRNEEKFVRIDADDFETMPLIRFFDFLDEGNFSSTSDIKNLKENIKKASEYIESIKNLKNKIKQKKYLSLLKNIENEKNKIRYLDITSIFKNLFEECKNLSQNFTSILAILLGIKKQFENKYKFSIDKIYELTGLDLGPNGIDENKEAILKKFILHSATMFLSEFPSKNNIIDFINLINDINSDSFLQELFNELEKDRKKLSEYNFDGFLKLYSQFVSSTGAVYTNILYDDDKNLSSQSTISAIIHNLKDLTNNKNLYLNERKIFSEKNFISEIFNKLTNKSKNLSENKKVTKKYKYKNSKRNN